MLKYWSNSNKFGFLELQVRDRRSGGRQVGIKDKNRLLLIKIGRTNN